MEIYIDTSLLGQTITNKINNQLDDMLMNKINDIDVFISKQKQDEHEEYISIAVIYILIHNTDDRDMTIYGKIFKNNQSFYDYRSNEYVFVYTKNPFIINKLISDLIKNNNNDNNKSLLFNFPIKDTIILKSDYGINDENNKIEKNNINCILLFMSPIVRLYFGLFKKFKFQKNERIIINSLIKEELFLLSSTSLLLGYNTYINVTNFINEKDDYFEKGVECFSFTEELEEFESRFFDYIIDTSGDFLIKNKYKAYEILNQGGNLIILDGLKENTQLDPHDLLLLEDKNCSLSFCKTNNFIKYCNFYGKIINFLKQVINTLISKNYNAKSMFKKLECKIWNIESLNQITMNEFINNKQSLNLFILE